MTRTVDPSLPGADLVADGLRDLERGIESAAALLVTIGAPRLRYVGLDVPEGRPDPELALYALLCAQHPRDAYAQYNALIRRLVSFEQAAEQERGRALRARGRNPRP
jgi:hypothetical protein